MAFLRACLATGALICLALACDDGDGSVGGGFSDGGNGGEGRSDGAPEKDARVEQTDAAGAGDTGGALDAGPLADAAPTADVGLGDAGTADAEVDKDGGPEDAGEVVECADDEGCPEGTYCAEGGACAEGCRTDPDSCPEAQRCDPVARACVGGEECLPDDLCGNRLDDDCDGSVDEGDVVVGLQCDEGQGVCAGTGEWACEDGALVCVGFEAAAGDELCDELDNDCDGAVDEDFPELGDVCAAGAGGCAVQGRVRCADGAAACDAESGAPQPEMCDRLDNDCDGATDEDFVEVGQPCTVGEGRCAEQGELVCAGMGGETRCNVVPGAPFPEECNGVDDDCDGQVDEGDAGPLREACYDGPAGTRGVGVCRAGQRSCVDGDWSACEGAVEPSDELCDDLDNDCDGEVDATDGGPLSEACYSGPEGTEGNGACAAGARVCRFGRFGACEGEVVPGVEICDQVDNDCNGETDEVDCGECPPGEEQACYGGPVGTEGTGACRAGTQRCRLDGAGFGACEGAVVPRAETCNDVDDDCDGAVDEDVGAGEPCGGGAGACAAEGVVVCAGGELVCDAEGGGPQPERCDEIDNDCDGATDEGFEVGVRCGRGVGACARAGLTVCDERGELACDAEPVDVQADETCNGIDDDCDGRIDEDFGVGLECEVGVGACARPGVNRCDGRGGAFCAGEPGRPLPEDCNGFDDDCDGQADEGFDLGAECEAGVGACRTGGATVCAERGGTTCDAVPDEPGEEVCNGADDDCDGFTDERLAQGGACETGAPGICADGQALCNRGQALCIPAAVPGRDVCDGLDNDCDGSTDENTGTSFCGQGVCRRRVPNCVDGGPPPECDAFAGAQPDELCNGLDDDCDGEVDEEAVGDGRPCGAGAGACQRVGASRCVEGELRCDATPGDPEQETCNAVDDDCDGATDEQTVEARTACAAGEGACRREANQICADGQVACPAEPGQGGAEVCNGVDDDCDGSTDEGFGAVECGVGACRNAVAACDGGDPPECDPFLGARDEVCNGVDDDCDGRTDEEVPGLGQACGAGNGACRAQGVTVCSEGRVTCDAELGEPSEEVCDLLDNDCDGRTDEDPVNAGQACSTGTGACARQGERVCLQGVVRCNAVAGPPGEEACNGADDDCDGATDEEQGNIECGVGECRRIVAACVNGVPTQCDPEDGAAPEQCNGVDDDCDGRVDEQSQGAGEPCHVGDGQCRRAGTVQCVDGGLACDAEPGQAFPETCDGTDDDCDRRVDEGFAVGVRCFTGLGLCRGEGTRVCNEAGDDTACDAERADPAPEACNGDDDDCDGSIDEGLDDRSDCQTGAPGICGAGQRRCAAGVERCDQLAEAGAEACNGLDDDCDGVVDEGLGTVRCGVGECVRDIVACTDGAPTRCDEDEGARPETCDGLDDDCDGRVDEEAVDAGAVCDRGEGGCNRVGVEVCVGGELSCDANPGEPQPELCNGTDDDCDGRLDEEPRDVRPCSAGEGACRREADLVCVNGALECPAEPGPGGAEVCNGVDDDCDAEIDEGFDGVECGVGACRRVLAACDGGEPPVCDPLEGAAAETCNGVDDDCDGSVDEDVDGEIGDPCSNGAGLCRREGVTVCAGGRVVCGAEPGAPAAERCNGLDEDCDNLVDEEPEDVGAPCSAGVGACSRDGQTFCDSGRVLCDAQPGAGDAEACNAVDDDCDGDVDENLGTEACGQGVCRRAVPACVDGQPGPCDPFQGAGEELCNGNDDDCDGAVDEDTGTVRCGIGACDHEEPRCVNGVVDDDCDPRQGADAETCNGLDDDCDGVVDENAINVGNDCTAGLGDCRAAGTFVCDDGELICTAPVGQPIPEQCDLADNDCDGRADEELGGQPCTAGAGACEVEGQSACVDGVFTCDAQPGDGGPEQLCDGVDNDCDGRFDEGQPDCDLNQRADRCDLEAGAPDCNQNGVPDACDLAGGDSQDCNGNGVPDECNGDGNDCEPDVEAPAVELFLSAEVVNPGTVVQAVVQAQDDRGVVQRRLTVDGRLEPLDAQGQAFVQLDEPGLVTFVGFAEDAAGNVGRDDGVVRVLDPDDNEAPQLAITAPPNGSTIDRATDVVGTVTDANLVRWTLSWGPLDDPGRNLLTDAEQPVVDGPLGVLDPAIIPPGRHGLQLFAEDVNGRSATLQGEFVVEACEPVGEICNGVDDDCDGEIDEGCPPDDTAPVVDVRLGAEAVNPGTDVPVVVDARDDRAVVSRSATFDGRAVVLDVNGQGTVRAEAPGFYDVEGTARDQAGNEGRDVATLRVLDPDDADPPQLAIDAPPNGAEIDRLTDVVGSVRDANLVYWSLTYGPVDEPDAFVLADGDTEVDAALLGRIDPNVIPLGEYALQLRGEDINGRASTLTGGFTVVECEAAVETCNGADDDCDGRIDEGFAVGAVCERGVGACERAGEIACTDDGRAVCDAQPGAPAPERCDAVDHDCDGAIDEGFGVGDDCVSGRGECARAGTVACANGAAACDAEPGDPAAEVCDGADNDCDGQSDEGFQRVTCGLGNCRHTVSECDAGGLECDPLEGAEPETCDGADQDCDGQIDEEAGDVGADCEAGVGACARPGQTVCDGGALSCDAQPGDPVDETCNGADDDCDGRIDEEAVDAGGGCDEGVGACARAGRTQCVDGQLACDAQPGAPADEVCNGVDDDCDGEVDDAPGDVGEPCQVGAGACVREGVTICERGRVECGAENGEPVEEACNQLDDDCDGAVDEQDVCNPAGNLAPVFDSEPPPGVDAGFDYVYRPSAVDPNGDPVTFAVVDGPPGLALVNGQVVWRTEAADIGVHDVELSAEDGRGGEDRQRFAIIVFDPDDDAPPVARIDAPALDAVLEDPTAVAGTADDPDLALWTLEHRLNGEDIWFVVAEGRDPVIDADFGVFDTTAVPNGLHELRLTVVDLGGNQARDTVRVQVDDGLKLGNFQIRFTDLVVPAAGLSIEVSRSYDSANLRTGDFGVGWTLDLVSVEVQKNVEPGIGWETVQECGGFFCQWRLEPTQAHILTFVMPDGGQQQFFFNPQIVNPFDRRFARPRWDPLPGTRMTMQVLDESGDLIVNGDELVDFDFEIYDPERFRLTAQNGTVMEFDGQRLTRIVDRNGNELAFSANGITHSTGRSLSIERDGQGRITRILDPDGGELRYEYDPRGDLTKFIDRDGGQTVYIYDRNHRLLEWVEPDGSRPLHNQYDERGRLVQSADAEGNASQIEYDDEAHTQTTIDPRGARTTWTYDDDGNVTAVTDALGHTFQQTYDDQRRPQVFTDPLGREIRLGYGDGDQITALTLPNGATEQYAYNDLGLMERFTDPEGRIWSWRYDDAGNVIAIVEPDGSEALFEYDDRGLLIRSTFPDGRAYTLGYDRFGSIDQVSGPGGGVLDLVYDDLGRVVAFDVDGQRTELVHDPTGELVEAVDPLGHVFEWERDADGRVLREVGPNGEALAFERDRRGGVTELTLPNGATLTREYDDVGNVVRDGTLLVAPATVERDLLGQATRVTHADGTTEEYEYDAVGRLTRSVDRMGRPTTLAYDEMDRLSALTRPDGVEAQIEYDDSGRIVALRGDRAEPVRYEYDARGRQRAIVSAEGERLDVEYDALDRPTLVADADGVAATFEYTDTALIIANGEGHETRYEVEDHFGLSERIVDPRGVSTSVARDASFRPTVVTRGDGSQTTLAYDPNLNNRQPVRRVDPNGDETLYELDARGFPLSVRYPDDSAVLYEYGPVGQVTRMIDDLGPRSFEYDGQLRRVGLTLPGGDGLAWGFDAENNITRLQHPHGVVTWRYDAVGKLDLVTDEAGGEITYLYDGETRTGVDHPNGASTRYAYDAAGRLVQREVLDPDGAPIGLRTYTWTASGERIASEVDGAGLGVTYTYDMAGRLTRAAVSFNGVPAENIGYTYDPAGNVLSRTDNQGRQDFVYAADSNRLVSDGACDYSYDANGNRTERDCAGEVTTYEYDFENRLVRLVAPDGLECVFEYQGDTGLRTRKACGDDDRRYLVDDNETYGNVVAELDAQGNVLARYTWAEGDVVSMEIDGADHVVHYDEGHNVVLVTDADGAVAARYGYDPYGRTLLEQGAVENPWRWKGYQLDPETGLLYARARYYDPEAGRFLTRDDFEPEPTRTTPPDLNLYAFGDGNPINAQDPNGRFFSLSGAMVSMAIQGILRSMQVLRYVNILRRTLFNIHKAIGPAFTAFGVGMFIIESTFGLPDLRNSFGDRFRRQPTRGVAFPERGYSTLTASEVKLASLSVGFFRAPTGATFYFAETPYTNFWTDPESCPIVIGGLILANQVPYDATSQRGKLRFLRRQFAQKTANLFSDLQRRSGAHRLRPSRIPALLPFGFGGMHIQWDQSPDGPIPNRGHGGTRMPRRNPAGGPLGFGREITTKSSNPVGVHFLHVVQGASQGPPPGLARLLSFFR